MKNFFKCVFFSWKFSSSSAQHVLPPPLQTWSPLKNEKSHSLPPHPLEMQYFFDDKLSSKFFGSSPRWLFFFFSIWLLSFPYILGTKRQIYLNWHTVIYEFSRLNEIMSQITSCWNGSWKRFRMIISRVEFFGHPLPPLICWKLKIECEWLRSFQ